MSKQDTIEPLVPVTPSITKDLDTLFFAFCASFIKLEINLILQ